MKTVVHAKKREAGKRSVMSSIRANGFAPAIVYGKNITATPIAIHARDFEKTLRKNGRGTIFTLDIEGNQIHAIIKDLQWNLLKEELTHIDFFETKGNVIEVELDLKIEEEKAV
ncbi:50S ribosomal protein L25 [Rummeliibacillus pycnus]|uniref:50S ribosomal protein L25 n=1 Tax=Rummeliibacillus pycnus TaxID=101070 RepID=UPI000C9C65C7|nr:50S ribosomal protein L25 [Rummeliibacillus pycnus]